MAITIKLKWAISVQKLWVIAILLAILIVTNSSNTISNTNSDRIIAPMGHTVQKSSRPESNKFVGSKVTQGSIRGQFV